MSKIQLPNNLYGFTSPLTPSPFVPIVAKRAPLTTDYAPLGALWIEPSASSAWILVSIISNVADWISFTGGAGAFSSLVVTGNSTLGGVTGSLTTLGNSNGTTTVDINVGSGGFNISGNTTSTGTITATTFYATGDAGGVAAETALTNVSVPVAGGTGAFTITSATTSGAATNAGFLKLYLGTVAVFVPYYTTTA